MYKDKELRLINNGHLSAPIFPSRGLAKGCGLSPLLFILVIETFALAVRDNPNIEGIQCGDTHKKISLLADDAMLALRDTHATVTEVLDTLKKFAAVSSLMVNMEKSVIMPIGKGKGTDIKTPGLEVFKQVGLDPVGYLGVDILAQNPNDTSVYTLIMEHFRAITRDWDTQDHTLLGRILTVRSLLGSKLVYLFMVAPSPSKEIMWKIQSLFSDYIWASGKHHINMNTSFLALEKGGLNILSASTREQSLKF